MTERTAVYRCYSEAGELLYVGATSQIDVRMKAHERAKPGWPQVTRVDTTWHETRAEALAAETLAIATELPAWNRKDHPNWQRPPVKRSTRDELRSRLDAGEWLKAGQVAALFGIDPATVHRWLASGKLAYRRVGGDGQRVADPVAVRARLAASREVHGGES